MDNYTNDETLAVSIEKGRLYEAAAFGDIKTIKFLVKKQGIDVNASDDHLHTGSTPLIWSIINSKVKVAKLLIRMGADIHGSSFNERTAYEWAESSSNLKIVNLLKKRDANRGSSNAFNRVLPSLLRKLANGYSSSKNDNLGQKSITNMQNAIHDAVLQRNSHDLKNLLKADGKTTSDGVPNYDLNKKNRNGDTPLHAAIKNKRWSTAKFLLSCGSDLTVEDDDGKPAVHLVFLNNANRKSDDTLKNMIMRGANPLICDASGNTIFELAYEKDDLRTVKIICKSLPLNSPFVFNVFEQAIREGSLEILKLLLKRWPRGAKDSNGNNLLHIAVSSTTSGNYEMVSEILETFDVNKVNNDGDTPLHLAVAKKLNEIVCLLLHNNADVNIQNNQGDTPLHVAAVQSNLLIFILLVDKCKNSLQNNDGDTAFHLAARYGRTDFVELMIKENKPSNDPYSSNHDVSKTARFKNIVNNNDWTALHYACAENNYKIVEKLLEIDVDSEIKNDEGKTALDICISMDHLSLVSLFKGTRLCGTSLASFLCTICIELPLAPNLIYKCANGHNYCDNCDDALKILQCPQCGIPIRKKLRNKEVEEKLVVMFPDADMQAHIDSFECLFEFEEDIHEN